MRRFWLSYPEPNKGLQATAYSRGGEFSCIVAGRLAHIDREETNVTNVTGFGRTASCCACSYVRRRRFPDGSSGPRAGPYAVIVGVACE